MPNQTIPITHTWGPVSASIAELDINQLGTLVAAQLSGAIRADVGFFIYALADPISYEADLIVNTQQRLFKGWDTSAGKYLPFNQFSVGQVLSTFSGVDDLANGWVILNGREITAIPGISGAQQAVLESFFGIGGFLPIVSPQNISGLPPAIVPAAGVIGALPVGNPPTQAEMTSLRNDTEILRTSTQLVLTAIQANTTPPLYSQMFVGYQ
jgi:hypothetical protein